MSTSRWLPKKPLLTGEITAVDFYLALLRPLRDARKYHILLAVLMTSRALSEIRPVPRRGLSRDESAMYIGVSGGKFDELVADGRMPNPIRIDGRKVWDIRSLDLAFDALPRENPSPNSWDDVRP